jgi:hypothetical protein
MGTYLNKAIKAHNSTPMDFNPSRIIKQDNPLHLQIPMLWGSSSDDLCDMMKTLASNIMTLQQKIMFFSTGNKVKYSQLR